MANRISCDLSKIEWVRMCKYAEVVSYSVPIECKYKNIIQVTNEEPIAIFDCPKDSGTDGQCNKRCYEYKIKKD